MKFRVLIPLVAVVTSLALASALSARQTVQESIDLSMTQMIREEGLERSHVAELVGHLTDVIGPRLTGSSGMRRANEWMADQFGFFQPLDAHPMAWSGSTNRTVRGPAVVLDISDTTDLARYRGQLRGAFVLVREAVDMEPEWAQTQAPRRFTLEHLFDSLPPPRWPPTIIHREREPLSEVDLAQVMAPGVEACPERRWTRIPRAPRAQDLPTRERRRPYRSGRTRTTRKKRVLHG